MSLTMENTENLAPSERLAQGFAAMVPMLILAVPMLLMPLLFPATVADPNEMTEQASGETAPIVQIVYPLLFGLTFLAFTRGRPVFTRKSLIFSGVIALFLAYAAVSSLWSLDPAFSLGKAIYQTLVCGLLFMSVSTVREPEKIFDWLFWMMALLIVINVGAIFAAPPSSIGHEGIYGHKNTLGANASAAILFAIYGIMRPGLVMKLAGISATAAGIFVLVASESKTSIGVAALAPVGALVLYVLARHLRMPPLFAMLFALTVAGALYVIATQIFRFGHEDVFLLIFNDVTFTGRTDIWAFTWEHILEKPLFGWGYQGFWGIGAESPRLTSEILFIHGMPYAHNGFLDIWLETGLIGLTLFMAIFFLVLAYVRKLVTHSFALGMLTLMIVLFCFGRNMMESNWMIGTTTASVLFLLIGMMAAVYRPAHIASLVPPPGGELAPKPHARPVHRSPPRYTARPGPVSVYAYDRERFS